MNRDGHETASFFVGTEVEHTPAYGMLTLFVVGVQSAEAIQEAIGIHQQLGGKPIKHIYFGANQSFPGIATNDDAEWRLWERMIVACLQDAWTCTLDIDVTQVEGLLESPLVEHTNFIPMISVKIPYIKQLGYNAVLKIDDRDFRATNPGVWCHSLHDLQKREVFTDWTRYTQDEVLK